MRLLEFDSPNKQIGRGGKFPDVISFGMTNEKITHTHKAFMDAESDKSAHYIILKDGGVYQYVNITDCAKRNETSILPKSENYYKKSSCGLVSCRPCNAATYTVSILFEGSEATEEQIQTASALVKVIGRKLMRIYKQKLPLNLNHMVDESVFPNGNCSGNVPIEEILNGVYLSPNF